ncbi:kif1, putative, partial [Schistosoma mansoni]
GSIEYKFVIRFFDLLEYVTSQHKRRTTSETAKLLGFITG